MNIFKQFFVKFRKNKPFLFWFLMIIFFIIAAVLTFYGLMWAVGIIILIGIGIIYLYEKLNPGKTIPV
jgi:hypothetical protein